MKQLFNDAKKSHKEAQYHQADHPRRHGIHHPAGKFLRHAVFGVNDGLVSTLGIVAGFTGATSESYLIVLAGVVAMFVGAISMALGTYISTKSQLEYYHMEYTLLKEDLKKQPDDEIQHLKEIYKKRGFTGKELDFIVNRLSKNKDTFLEVVTEEDLGFGKEELDNPFKAALTMFAFFILGCVVPIAPYFFFSVFTAFKISLLASMFLLFVIGTAKTYFTGRSWFRNGLEMVLVGALASTVAYYLGIVLEPILKLMFGL